MKNDRQQIFALWQGEIPQYYPTMPCGFWAETIARWQNEGLCGQDPNVAAGLDNCWLVTAPINFGMQPGFLITLPTMSKDHRQYS
jgi:hypothetical protein